MGLGLTPVGVGLEVCVVVVVVTMIKGEYTMADRDRFLEGSILSVPIN